jgi:flagellar hook-length control protein FliK
VSAQPGHVPSPAQGQTQSNSPAAPASNAIKAVAAADKALRPESKPQAGAPRFKLESDDKLAAQAARGLAAAIRQGRGSVTLRLTPEALGDLRIRVNLSDARVQATFEVETDQARQLLDKSLADLRTALEARGLEIESLDVRVAERTGHAPDHDPGNSFGGAGGEQHDGGAGHQSPRQDAGDHTPTGASPHAWMERSPPTLLADSGLAHGARPAQVLFIEPGGGPLMRVRLDAVA